MIREFKTMEDRKSPVIKFPTKKSCLKQVFNTRALKDPFCIACGESVTKYYKQIYRRKEFGCCKCRHKVSPLAGTPFHKTRIPLDKWFYVLALTKDGSITPKEIYYDFGISHKSALRMLKIISEWEKKLVITKQNMSITNFIESLPPLFEHERLLRQ